MCQVEIFMVNAYRARIGGFGDSDNDVTFAHAQILAVKTAAILLLFALMKRIMIRLQTYSRPFWRTKNTQKLKFFQIKLNPMNEHK